MKPLQITEVGRQAGIRPDELRTLGQYKGKVSLSLLERLKEKPIGKLVCVTSMTPAGRGEGKTCTSIGLAQGFGRLKKRTFVCLREPSFDSVLGVKGIGTGAGYAQVLPPDEINFHFTGDNHAVELATNVLAAVIENHIRHGNALDIDPTRIFWRRAQAVGAQDAFSIPAASEIMAILSLSASIRELKERLARIIAAQTRSGRPVTAQDLKAVGAMAVLLKDAIEPNLVQTMESQPCFVHTGAFANVSHGNSSVAAIRMAMKLADYVVTECGFAADQGLEKMFNLVSRSGGFEPNAVVIVATLRSLKAHSEKGRLDSGYENLERHVDNVRKWGIEPVVAINRTPEDDDHEIQLVTDYLRMKRIESAVSTAVLEGGEGATALAAAVMKSLQRKQPPLKPLYDSETPIDDKIRAVAREVYGADGVEFSEQAQADLRAIVSFGAHQLPVNILKTPLSLTDDPSRKGAPAGWNLRVESLRAYAGAGYVVAVASSAAGATSFPAEPFLEKMDLDESGKIIGVYE